MKLRIAAPDASGLPYQFLATYLVNDAVALDAGCLGLLPLETQQRIEHVFLSHSHLDHIATLAIFLDNVYRPGPQCPRIYALRETWEALGHYFFNDVVWPDLVRLSREEFPFVKFHELQPNTTVRAAGVRITPLPLNHVVPTCGFLVEDDVAAVALVSDTGPTDDVWRILNGVPNLRGLFLEASFPNRMQWLADKTRHLTPRTFAEEIAKLRPDVPRYVVHVKPAFFGEVAAEIDRLKTGEVARANVVYNFE